MNLTEEKKSQLKKIIILCLCAFLLVYGIIMYFKYSKIPNEQIQIIQNDSIIFTQPDLKIFSYKETLNLYPDRVLMHYPYFIVVKHDEWKSTIYNIDTKKKEKTFAEIVLDYYKCNTVYNKQGIETYYNGKTLGILCDQAFIKSSTEILCITRPDKNQIANKLISINPKTLEQKEIYKSNNVLTAIYYEKGTLYIGEYDFKTNKSYLIANKKSIHAPDLINIIYLMNNQTYVASFKSQRNKLRESYSIFNSKQSDIKKIKEKSIVFDNNTLNQHVY